MVLVSMLHNRPCKQSFAQLTLEQRLDVAVYPSFVDFETKPINGKQFFNRLLIFFDLLFMF